MAIYRQSALQLCALALALWAAGCGAGDEIGDGGGGEEIPPDQMQLTVAAADAAATQFDALCTERGWAEAVEPFAEWARAQPYVQQATVDADTRDVSLVYASGVFHVFHPDDDLDAGLAEAGPPVTRPRGLSTRSIPSAGAATAATSHPPATSNLAAVDAAVQTALDAEAAAGYQVPASAPSADVAWFRSWSSQGIVFFQGHGGFATNSDWSTPRQYCMQTSERFPKATGPGDEHEDDLAAGRVGFWTTEGDRTQMAYTVTTGFFRHYCDPMADGGIVYLNSCHGLDSLSEPAGVLCSLGTQVVFGWDGLCPRVAGARVAQYFFDRMCGLNSISPVAPPTRAFTTEQVFDQVLATQPIAAYDTEGHLVGVFGRYRSVSVDPPGSARPLLTGGFLAPPSALYHHAFVSLEGYFGEVPGQVLLDGAACTVAAWGPQAITAELPSDATAVGDVVVEVSGRRSNTLRLTRFYGAADVTVEAPGQYRGTIDVDVSGRAFTQRVRSVVDGDPVTVVGPWGSCDVAPEEGFVTWDISGDWVDDSHNRHHLVAQGTAPALSTQAGVDQPGALLQLTLDFDASPRTYRVRVLGATVTGTDTVTSEAGVVTAQQWHRSFVVRDPHTPQPLPANWAIPAGESDGDDCHVEWDEFLPDPSPTDFDVLPAQWLGVR